MSRARWLGWGLLLAVLAVLLFLARGPLRASADLILDRVKLREREAARRLEEVKLRDAEFAGKMATTDAWAAEARAKADGARKKARDIERERLEIAERLAEDIDDTERARSFRERHGLHDPRDPLG